MQSVVARPPVMVQGSSIVRLRITWQFRRRKSFEAVKRGISELSDPVCCVIRQYMGSDSNGGRCNCLPTFERSGARSSAVEAPFRVAGPFS